MTSECHIRVHKYDKKTLKPQRIVTCVEKMVSKHHIRVREYDILKPKPHTRVHEYEKLKIVRETTENKSTFSCTVQTFCVSLHRIC